MTNHKSSKHSFSKKRKGSSLNHGKKAHRQDHKKWSRRNFLSASGIMGVGGALALGGAKLQALASTPLLNILGSQETDRTLVIVRLGGGNDGLNTIVPRFNSVYYNARPTVAIQEADMIPLDAQYGMPNQMQPLESWWNDGKMAVVHSVAYPEQNLSHFRSSDIWATASNEDEYLNTGWIGRFFNQEYPSYNIAPPEYPIGLQIGTRSNLLFQGDGANLGLAVTNPTEFYQIAQTGQLYPTGNLPDCSFGEELKFVREVANSTVRFAEAIKVSYDKAENTATYPQNNFLANELAIVSRLIKGGLGTRIYLVEIGGFDTHAEQNQYHPELLTELSEAINAFLSDLAENDRAKENTLVMTISEFGRRVEENGSFGTDHGISAPMMLWGDGIVGGLKGTHADLNNLDVYGNMEFTTDFRSVYATVIQDWFCIHPQVVDAVLGQSFNRVSDLLPSCPPSVGSDDNAVLLGHNPQANNSAKFEIKYSLLQKGQVRLKILNLAGQTKATLVNAVQEANSYTVNFNPIAYQLPYGEYIYHLDAGGKTYSRKMKFFN